MENIHSCNVADLSDTSRRGLEDLLGASLRDDQRVIIMVLDPRVAPPAERQRRAAVGLRQLMERAQQHADSAGITEEEIDAAVEEAMAHVRRRQAN